MIVEQFNYSDDDFLEEDVEFENQYYASKGSMSDSPQIALSGFQQLLNSEQCAEDWKFKILKQIVKCHFQTGDINSMLQSYKEMLLFVGSSLPRSQIEKKLGSLMGSIGSSSNTVLLENFYETTLAHVADSNCERLTYKCRLKLSELWCDVRKYSKALQLIEELNKTCPTGSYDDIYKGLYSLDILALKMRIYSADKNFPVLKTLYTEACNKKAAVPHPRVWGIIKESGGLIYLRERRWSEAATEFFEAFKQFDEVGFSRKIHCLNYFIMTNMLMRSNVDPFDAQETKSYLKSPEMVIIKDLEEAYQHYNMCSFKSLLVEKNFTLENNKFFMEYLPDLLDSLRLRILGMWSELYKRVPYNHVSNQLLIPEEEIEAYLLGLIHDQQLFGKLNQVENYLDYSIISKEVLEKKECELDMWTQKLQNLQDKIRTKCVISSGAGGDICQFT